MSVDSSGSASRIEAGRPLEALEGIKSSPMQKVVDNCLKPLWDKIERHMPEGAEPVSQKKKITAFALFGTGAIAMITCSSLLVLAGNICILAACVLLFKKKSAPVVLPQQVEPPSVQKKNILHDSVRIIDLANLAGVEVLKEAPEGGIENANASKWEDRLKSMCTRIAQYIPVIAEPVSKQKRNIVAIVISVGVVGFLAGLAVNSPLLAVAGNICVLAGVIYLLSKKNVKVQNEEVVGVSKVSEKASSTYVPGDPHALDDLSVSVDGIVPVLPPLSDLKEKAAAAQREVANKANNRFLEECFIEYGKSPVTPS